MEKLYSQPPKLDFNDVLIRPRRSPLSSRSEVDLNSSRLKQLLSIETNGIVAANMDGVGTIEVAKVLRAYGCMTALHKHYDMNTLLEFFSSEESSHSFYSMGIAKPDIEKFYLFHAEYKRSAQRRSIPLKICIDVANGYMEKFSEFCNTIRDFCPDVIIMAGNVVDVRGANHLTSANIVKVGIGQGSNCLTRTQTGIGYPQFSTIYDIFNPPDYDPALDAGKLICSDGGCVTPGDVSKAIAAGADMVMLGGMLAGTDQGGGDIIEIAGQKFVEFYGMSSATAQKKHNGGLKEYRSSEGRTTLIPYKGDMNAVIQNILGGVRSTCTYVGAETIDELHAKSSFIRVNSVINRSMEKFTVGM